jgi:hypothetical protein
MPRPSRSERAVARLTLGFGNLAVPVLVLPFALASSLPVTPCVRSAEGDLTPVRTAPVTPSGEVVPASDVVAGLAVADRQVTVDEPFLRDALGLGAVTPLTRFVDVDRSTESYVVNRRYRVVADTTNVTGERAQARVVAFSALLEALRAENAEALLVTTFEGTPRFAALSEDATLCTLFFAHEETNDATLPPASGLDEATLIRARMIVARSRSNVALPLTDEFGPTLRAALDASPEVRAERAANPTVEVVEIVTAPSQVAEAIRSTIEPPTPDAAPRRRVRMDTIADEVEPTIVVTSDFDGTTITVTDPQDLTRTLRMTAQQVREAQETLQRFTLRYNTALNTDGPVYRAPTRPSGDVWDDLIVTPMPSETVTASASTDIPAF